MDESDAKQAEKDKQHAIKEYKQQSRALEGCNRCLDNRETIKHLIVSVGSKAYLALPAHTPLTSGHCLIIPAQHISCSVQADEDVWEEIQRFRRALVSMLSEEEEDCVFFESAMNLKKWPHMVTECVPLPREVGDLAPIYFKKAILESEGEWTQNKKLIELRGRDIRRAVPKALPYFSCDFGNESGFAHVIEEEREFPKNFAQEIIGGMLDLDHSIWRKPKREDFELQMARINEFKEKWKKYDFSTKTE
ncbi:CWF19-like protein 2 [Artemia franciscana]